MIIINKFLLIINFVNYISDKYDILIQYIFIVDKLIIWYFTVKTL